MHPCSTTPVYGGYLADPFIFFHAGIYYAVGTAPRDTSCPTRAIPLLQSNDLIHWQFVHLALHRSDSACETDVWAPEVAFDGRRFFMYYSAGCGDKNHQLHVAVSTTPQGPYRDLSGPLHDPAVCPFAIDPHPFQDDDGQWYLFYARDFLDCDDGAQAGTALAMDRLIGMSRLAGEERIVLRARHDWQRFQAGRLMYGRVFDWHTLEGPFVRKRHGHYYCFYSGGCWDSVNYGVDYAVAECVSGPYVSAAEARHGPRVLRTVPDRLLGPGHNSIVTSPEGDRDYLVYHAWDSERLARRMHIAPLLWTGDGPRIA